MFHKPLFLGSRSFKTATALLGVVIVLGTVALTLSHAQNDGSDSHSVNNELAGDPLGAAAFDCSRLEELHIEKQTNPRAGAILQHCRRGSAGAPVLPQTLVDIAFPRPSSPLALGGTDINLVTTSQAHPLVTQAESSAWGHGNTIVVAMDGSQDAANSLCSVSVSTDGGASFTRLAYRFTDGGACYGDPSVFYSRSASKWFIGFIAARCANGYGQWESLDGITWVNSGCYANAGTPDGLTTWVDNNVSSPFYGRQYAAFNNFAVAGGAIQMVFSNDHGLTWTTPVIVSPTFRRSVKITGSLGSDGGIYVQAMDEGGGGLNGPRVNYIYRSIDGGLSWSGAFAQGTAFLGSGRSVSGYFAGMYTTPVAGYWRQLGWGQPGVGPSGVVHYTYASRPGTPFTDPGNVFYIRSIDNGSTWSSPLQMNTDASGKAQWQPSLAVNAQGKIVVTWFDERNDATSAPTEPNSLQRYGRVSLDNGLTWQADTPVSDVLFPKPLQPDSAITSTYAGDRHDASFSNDNFGSTAYDTWTDGRVLINGPQQDVFFDKINFAAKSLFDFDGDGKTDLGIFRPALAQWWINRSSNGSTYALQFGSGTDQIVPADYTGDGKTDIAIWRPSTGEWYILRSENNSFYSVPFGTTNDTPAPADFDADGKSDVAVFRPSSSTWYISRSSGGTTIAQFGTSGDLPVADDYDADGRADIAIYRPSNGQWWLSRSTAGVIVHQFGNSTDKVVQGDYTGDGKSDVAFWRPSSGEWYILRSEDLSYYSVPFGSATDIPAPGDYDGDGRFDTTVFRPSTATWYSQRTTSGTLIQQFGSNGDRPLPNAFVR